jgi:hypothetical protein
MVGQGAMVGMQMGNEHLAIASAGINRPFRPMSSEEQDFISVVRMVHDSWSCRDNDLLGSFGWTFRGDANTLRRPDFEAF